MKYHILLTRKYLVSRLIAILAILAVAFGVVVLMVTLSVMEGFKVEMRDRIRGTLSHIQVMGDTYFGVYAEDEALEKLREHPDVVAAAPYVGTLAIFKSPRDLNYCNVRGIDPQAETKVGNLSKYLLREDEWRELALTEDSRLPDDRQPLSQEEIDKLFSLEHRRAIARYLGFEGFELDHPPQPVIVGIQAVKFGMIQPYNLLQLSSYSGVNFTPVQKNFLVVGVFQTGVHEEDARTIYMPLRAAQNFLELWDDREGIEDYRLSGISIRLNDYRNVEAIRADLEGNLLPLLPGGLRLGVRTWEDQRKTLLKAVDIEKKIIYFLLLGIVVFAGFIIFIILWLMVFEKTRDLGVLASLGAPPGGVLGMFTILGMVLCLTGATLGGLIGWAFTANINAIHDWITRTTGWQLFPPDVYYLTEIPVVYTPRDFVVIFVPTFVFGFLGSVVPAWVASRKDPIRALRHE